jgi:hypothetical protein
VARVPPKLTAEQIHAQHHEKLAADERAYREAWHLKPRTRHRKETGRRWYWDLKTHLLGQHDIKPIPPFATLQELLQQHRDLHPPGGDPPPS